MWRNRLLLMYESMNVSLPDSHFRGFCLTCRQQSDTSNVLLYSIECNENAMGYCVMRNGSVSLTFTMSFASYWMQCRNHNLYIIGDTRWTFCQKEHNAWTGLQKYKITNSVFDNDSCYIIETHQTTVNYKKEIVRKNFSFFVKKNSVKRTFLIQNISEVQKVQHQPPLPVNHYEQHINVYPTDPIIFLQHLS